MKGKFLRNKNIRLAHKYSAYHKNELTNDKVCGCFYCVKIFAPNEIKIWLDCEGTSLCPYCGTDSVIGESSGFPITEEFLTAMRKYWFNRFGGAY